MAPSILVLANVSATSALAARYLEIGTRVDADKAHYPDDDLMWGRDEHGKEIPLHKDGTRYPP